VALIGLSRQIDGHESCQSTLGKEIMGLKPGDVVLLKSGGHPMTVAEVDDDDIACVWMGTEGELFRETLSLAVLEAAEIDDDEEDDEEEEEE
jgi:uncharacterized protein YodC (DUF2158 family)